MFTGCFKAERLCIHQFHVEAVVAHFEVKIVFEAGFEVIENVVASGAQLYGLVKLGAIDASCHRAVKAVHQVQVTLTFCWHMCVSFLK